MPLTFRWPCQGSGSGHRGRAESVEHPDVLAEQVVPFVQFGNVVAHSLSPGTANERIGLTRRTTDQNRVIKIPAQTVGNPVDRLGSGIGPERQTACLFRGNSPGSRIDVLPVHCGGPAGKQGGERVWQGAVRSLVLAQKGSQRQGTMG